MTSRPGSRHGWPRSFLGTIQDDISEALTQPWPTLGGAMLNADARQVGDVVEMWFGAEHGPALRLRSLKVPDPAGWS